jgi:natural product biosynthesis luciferase-like monooxygenase protein
VLAGQLGANVLASMGSQPLDDLANKIRRYRDARREAGHDPATGIVSLMLHTFLGEDDAAVKRTVREPMAEYLYTHMRQRDSFVQVDRITTADKHALTELAFEHYFENASLLGTIEKCSRMIDRLERAGVDELACLIDFGVDAPSVLHSLELLDILRAQHVAANAAALEAAP